MPPPVDPFVVGVSVPLVEPFSAPPDIAPRFKPAAGPLRFAMPPPAPGNLKPPGKPPAPAPGAGELLMPPIAIGPAEPTLPKAPPDIGTGEGRPGPDCPASIGLFVALPEDDEGGAGDDEDEGPPVDEWRKKADVGMRSDAPMWVFCANCREVGLFERDAIWIHACNG